MDVLHTQRPVVTPNRIGFNGYKKGKLRKIGRRGCCKTSLRLRPRMSALSLGRRKVLERLSGYKGQTTVALNEASLTSKPASSKQPLRAYAYTTSTPQQQASSTCSTSTGIRNSRSSQTATTYLRNQQRHATMAANGLPKETRTLLQPDRTSIGLIKTTAPVPTPTHPDDVLVRVYVLALRGRALLGGEVPRFPAQGQGARAHAGHGRQGRHRAGGQRLQARRQGVLPPRRLSPGRGTRLRPGPGGRAG